MQVIRLDLQDFQNGGKQYLVLEMLVLNSVTNLLHGYRLINNKTVNLILTITFL